MRARANHARTPVCTPAGRCWAAGLAQPALREPGPGGPGARRAASRQSGSIWFQVKS